MESQRIPNKSELAKTQKHTIYVVVDRIVVKEAAKSRIADSVQLAMGKADGVAVVEVDKKEIIYSEKLACPKCNISFTSKISEGEILNKIFNK
mgnify:CR=1 FL=1